MLNNSQNSQVINSIRLFKKNAAITQVSKNFFNKLLQTKSGKVVKLFELWKSLPDQNLARRKKKAIKFESQLNKMALKFIKRGFEPFKEESFEARNRKKYCLNRLVAASMGEEKKKFILWRQIVKEDKVLKHSKIF